METLATQAKLVTLARCQREIRETGGAVMQLAGSVESSPVVQEILHSSLSFIMVLKFRDENTERNSASGLVGCCERKVQGCYGSLKLI